MLIVAPLDGVSVEMSSIGLSLIETFCDKFSDSSSQSAGTSGMALLLAKPTP